MRDPKEILFELLKLPSENEVVEFKEANTSFDFEKLGQYFSALSNEANLRQAENGWLIFGIRDKDRALVNSQYKKDLKSLMKLKFDISKQTSSGLSFTEIFQFEAEPGKRVVMFQIPPAPVGVPVSFKGHFYAREDENLIPLNMEKFERIRIQVNLVDWSKKIVREATIEDLEPKAIEKARKLFANKNPHLADQVENWDDATFLDKARITIKGKITNTAILLLGKPESTPLISPAVSKISWILKSNGVERDYQHFTSPLILSVDMLYSKIRNLTYRYTQEATLFPQEVSMYDQGVIREALNNCIAHQDYTLGGKINVVENDEESLVFSNKGSFLPVLIENVIKSDAPSEFYRNRFLADAMVNLSMIDTIGSGIRRMFISQKDRFFPLPEYDISDKQVTVTIIGKVLDMNYARKLAQLPELSLETIMLLDKVQKKMSISADEALHLRNLGLVEGKRPNLIVSSKIATRTDQQVDYMHRKGIDDAYCKKMILDFLEITEFANRSRFEELLIEKLPSDLSLVQKKNKIKNILQSLKKLGKIEPTQNKEWTLTKQFRARKLRSKSKSSK